METIDKLGIIIFGVLGVIALIGSFWNSSQLAIAGMCACMVTVSYFDLKKERKNK